MQVSPRKASPASLPSWRLVAAGFLHFGLLGYLISVVPLSLLLAPSGAGAAGVLRVGLRLTGVFLLAFIALGIACVTIAAALDRRTRRHLRRSASAEPAIAQERVAAAMATARHAFDSSAQPVLASLTARAWDYGDHRYQAVARDLDIVVRTAAAALNAAPPEQTRAVQQDAAKSLYVIDQALGEIERARASAAARDARTATLYIQNRYGAADFTIKPD